MRFTPTDGEVATESFLQQTPLDINSATLNRAGSSWDEAHLNALRVVLFQGLPTERLIPKEFIPQDNQAREAQSGLYYGLGG